MTQKPSERLTARLIEMGYIDETAKFERTRAGRLQREEGAWSWYIYSPRHTFMPIGSQSPVSSILKCPNWQIVCPHGEYEIWCGCPDGTH